MSDKLTASEALYGFCGWLTTRDMKDMNDRIIMSPIDDCAAIPSLVEQFCKENKLAEPREGWRNNLIHPRGECSSREVNNG